MGEIKELSYFKLKQERERMLSHLREQGILHYTDSILEYSEKTTDYGANIIDGESSIELSVKFTVYEEVALLANQVRDLEEGKGQFKILNSKFVRPIDIEIVYKTLGSKGTIVGFHYSPSTSGVSNVVRQLDFYFSRTQNGTNLVSNSFLEHENIIEGAYKKIIDCVEKVSEGNLYSRLLDEVVLPSDNNTIEVTLEKGHPYYKVMHSKDTNKTELDISTNKGLSHQLAVLFK